MTCAESFGYGVGGGGHRGNVTPAGVVRSPQRVEFSVNVSIGMISSPALSVTVGLLNVTRRMRRVVSAR